MKKTIWSNLNMNINDWKEFLDEEYPEITNEYEQYSLVLDLENEMLNDERINLDIKTDGRIIAIGDIGRWNGRVHGYKILGNNISNILYSDCDYCEWYSDGYNIKFTGHHHDGTNYYEYRILRENRNIDKFLEDLYLNNNITRKKINYYTSSLLPNVAKVYGW